MGKCAFCPNDAAKLTGEHIWSEWISRLLGPGGGYNFRKLNAGGSIVNEWHRPSINLKANIVCGDCNSGWMSDLENREAKPLLQYMIRDGVGVSLLPRGIAALAAWAFKSAVVANHMYPDEGQEPFFSPFARNRFRTALEIPLGVQMWIAAFQGVHAHSGTFNSAYLKPSSTGLLSGIEFYVFTYGAGHLVLQILAARWKRLHRRHHSLPVLNPNNFWDTAAIRFWPSDGRSVLWPPPHYLNDDSIKVFSNRWDAPIDIATRR